MNENKQLEKVYNGNQTIMNAGFTMVSNYIVPVLARMKAEKLITISAQNVMQTLLQFKHSEEAPYPSQKTIGELLGFSEEYAKKAVGVLRKAGILGTTLINKVNHYDLTPFFDLVEKFIFEFKHNGKRDIKIAELLEKDVDVQGKKHDFSWAKEYNKEEVAEVVLPESINNVVKLYNVDSEGIDAIEKAYAIYSEKVSDKLFCEKIIASSDKKNFKSFFNKCISNAYMNNEQPKEQAKPQTPSKEVVPEWFDDRNKPVERKTNAETYAEMNQDELLKTKHDLDFIVNNEAMKNNKSIQLDYKMVTARLNNMNLSASELEKIAL